MDDNPAGIRFVKLVSDLISVIWKTKYKGRDLYNVECFVKKMVAEHEGTCCRDMSQRQKSRDVHTEGISSRDV